MTIDEKEVHANHVEAFNAAIRRHLSAFRRRTNTYAKGQEHLQRVLDIFWITHKFCYPPFYDGTSACCCDGDSETGIQLGGNSSASSYRLALVYQDFCSLIRLNQCHRPSTLHKPVIAPQTPPKRVAPTNSPTSDRPP